MIDLYGIPFSLHDAQAAWVKETLESLSDREKIGQLFCVLGELYEADELKSLARDYGLGGVLFRTHPTEALRAKFIAADAAARVPLLHAANLEEGGSGGVTDGTLIGSQMAVAATGDPKHAARLGSAAAAEGLRAGINWTFSPVCDIDYNFHNPITNVRTYGSDPDTVARFAFACMQAVQQSGMAACAKHFPGDGVDYRDHHLHPTYNTLSAADWYASYGKVYQTLIEGGLLSVMCGHIAAPSVEREIDPSLCFAECTVASQSANMLQGVLRGKLGFNGLITTDATIMGGYCMTKLSRREAIVASIAAGCDMLVFNTDFYEDYAAVQGALKSGGLSRERLDEAVTRVLALKARVCLAQPPSVVAPIAAWQRELADRAVTLVKNRGDVLPLAPDRYPVIRLIPLGNDDTYDGSMTQIVTELLEQRGFAVEAFDFERESLVSSRRIPDDRLTLYLANIETKSDQTAVRISWSPKFALDLPRYAAEQPYAFVSFANPYHLQDVPCVPVYVNAYTASRAMMTAVIEKLCGESEFVGQSPVDAFCDLPDTRC